MTTASLQFTELLQPEAVVISHENISIKKQAMELLAKLLSTQTEQQIKYQSITNALLERERLGSTALGHNIAIPHARIAELEYPVVAVLKLEKPIIFSEQDNLTANILFGLLVPQDATEAHIKLLADIANTLNQTSTQAALQAADSAQKLYSALEHAVK